jgi:hypothetical protein
VSSEHVQGGREVEGGGRGNLRRNACINPLAIDELKRRNLVNFFPAVNYEKCHSMETLCLRIGASLVPREKSPSSRLVDKLPQL